MSPLAVASLAAISLIVDEDVTSDGIEDCDRKDYAESADSMCGLPSDIREVIRRSVVSHGKREDVDNSIIHIGID